MSRSTSRRLFILPALILTAGLTGCGLTFGDSGPQYSSTEPGLRPGEKLFNQRCGGCHTFDKAGTEGSAVNAHSRELKDGPNFNVRKESYDAVLYAIRNGGFSSGPMPQNVVVGREAELVACFVATYSGAEAASVPTPVQTISTDNTDCRKELGLK